MTRQETILKKILKLVNEFPGEPAVKMLSSALVWEMRKQFPYQAFNKFARLSHNISIELLKGA